MPGEARVVSDARAVPDDDAGLLRRSASGDTAAFDIIVDAHSTSVSRFLTSLGVNDLEDALQETFIAAWQSAASFRGTGSVRSWLLSIARNVHRHSLRRRVDEPMEFVSLDALAERAGWGCDPAETRRADIAIARDELEHALAKLPVDEREILVLRELEELSGEETAQLLHLTVPAMKSRLHRARLHLAAVLRQADLPHTSTGSTHGRR
ncbi:MAG: RNA polymerase sigma factor [Gemmatimonas sp.]